MAKQVLLKVGCAVGKQPSIPLINLEEMDVDDDPVNLLAQFVQLICSARLSCQGDLFCLHIN